ncbi:MAG: class I SAM-dependent methyltransferase [Acidobacteriota bacterium]
MVEVLEYEYESGFCWIVRGVPRALGDEPADHQTDDRRSTLVVLENGAPLAEAHAPHENIRSLGRGRYSHWTDSVRFSTSDNSNPLMNGRSYALATRTRTVTLKPVRVTAETAARIERTLAERRALVSDVDRWCTHAGGREWRLDLGALWAHHGATLPADPAEVRLVEDDRAIPVVPEVWPFIRFAASDGTHPKLNGRRYDAIVGGRRLRLPQSPQALALTGPTPPIEAGWARLVGEAQRAGATVDIDLPSPNDYQRFLAGLVRHFAWSRVLEIGTEFGRSGLSIVSGLGPRLETFVTVDLADRAPVLDGRPGVHRVIGDAGDPVIIRRVLDHFRRAPIDMLFVDSGHDYQLTLAHFASYAALLRPKLVAFDDIVLNEEMARFWSDLRATAGPDAVNACDIDPTVRSADCGFGLLALDRSALGLAPRA